MSRSSDGSIMDFLKTINEESEEGTTTPVRFPYLSDEEVQMHIKAAISRASQMIGKLEKWTPPFYEDLFPAYEDAAAAVSQFYQLFPYITKDESMVERISKTRDIHIDYKQDCLRITMHPLLPTPTKGGYNSYREVKEELTQFLQRNNISFDLQSTYVLIYERVVKGDVHLKIGISDNDNLETRRITNAIVDSVGIQDSADRLSFLYTTVPGEDYRMNIYFTHQNALKTTLPQF